MPTAENQADGGYAAQGVDEVALSIRDMDAWYGQMQVLFSVNMDVRGHEIVGLLGHNGSGKSTVLRVVAGLHRRSDYEVLLGGESLAHTTPHLVARKGLVLVPGADVFEGVTVEEHLRLGARLGRRHERGPASMDVVYDSIPVLADMRHRFGPELSGGQRQLLALGMAFMANPRCLLLDEPSTGLDVHARRAVASVLQRFAEQGVPQVVVEQNPTWLAEIARRAYLIELGRIVAEGPPLSLVGSGAPTATQDGR